MDFLDISLILSILSCTFATGFMLTYAVVVMHGLSKLDDKEFIRAFQVTDGEIQNNQPLFILTWLGSIISVSGAILSSIISIGLQEAWLIIFVGAVYLFGVQSITISVHLPLNNLIQKMNINKLNYETLREERIKFETKWNYFRLLNLAIDGIVSFTTAPLRFSTALGMIISLFAFGYIVYLVVRTLLFGSDLAGYPSIMAVVLFLGGVQLLSLGIIGEYIGRIFNETKRRPLYLIDEYHATKGKQ